MFSLNTPQIHRFRSSLIHASFYTVILKIIHVSTTLWQQNQPSYQDKSHMRESLAERKAERLMSVRSEFDWGVKLMGFVIKIWCKDNQD